MGRFVSLHMTDEYEEDSPNTFRKCGDRAKTEGRNQARKTVMTSGWGLGEPSQAHRTNLIFLLGERRR